MYTIENLNETPGKLNQKLNCEILVGPYRAKKNEKKNGKNIE